MDATAIVPGRRNTYICDASTGNSADVVNNALNVNVVSGGGGGGTPQVRLWDGTNFVNVISNALAVNVANFPSSQAVTGPLTNTELRAAPVAVTGTFFQATQPVSQSGTWNVGITGTVAVTQSGTWTTGRTWTLASASDSVATVQSGAWTVAATQSGAWTVAISGAVAVTQSTSPWVVSGTVTANIGTTNGLALDATLTGGTQKAIARGGAKGATVAADVTSTSIDANTQGLDVSVKGVVSISGTIAATQSGVWSTGRTWTLVSGTDSVASVQSGTWTVAVSGVVAVSQSGTWTTGRTWSLASPGDSVSAVQSGSWTTGRTWALASAGDSVAAVQSGAWTVAATQSGAWNITNITGTISLPTGAATAVLQTTGNTSLATIATNQTNGTQKTQIVDGASGIAGPVMANSGFNHLPVFLPLDVTATTQNITAQDTASVSVGGYANQNRIIGTPTAGSAASYILNSVQTVMLDIQGLWTGTLNVEVSSDGGTTWVARSIHVVGTSVFSAAITSTVVGSLNASAKTNVRVRAVGAWTGTATIRMLSSDNPSNFYVANAIRITDGSSVLSTTQLTIKAASIAPVATDTAAVVALSPNGNQATAALQTTINTTQTSGAQKTQVVDVSGNVLPSGDVAGRRIFTSVTDGTNTTAVKPASTAAVAADPALVVAISPNSRFSSKNPLTPAAPAKASLTAASATIVTANSLRGGLVIQNNSAATAYLGFGAVAVLLSGITLYPGGVFNMNEYNFATTDVRVIGSALATDALSIQEYNQ